MTNVSKVVDYERVVTLLAELDMTVSSMYHEIREPWLQSELYALLHVKDELQTRVRKRAYKKHGYAIPVMNSPTLSMPSPSSSTLQPPSMLTSPTSQPRAHATASLRPLFHHLGGSIPTSADAPDEGHVLADLPLSAKQLSVDQLQALIAARAKLEGRVVRVVEQTPSVSRSGRSQSAANTQHHGGQAAIRTVGGSLILTSPTRTRKLSAQQSEPAVSHSSSSIMTVIAACPADSASFASSADPCISHQSEPSMDNDEELHSLVAQVLGDKPAAAAPTAALASSLSGKNRTPLRKALPSPSIGAKSKAEGKKVVAERRGKTLAKSRPSDEPRAAKSLALSLSASSSKTPEQAAKADDELTQFLAEQHAQLARDLAALQVKHAELAVKHQEFTASRQIAAAECAAVAKLAETTEVAEKIDSSMVIPSAQQSCPSSSLASSDSFSTSASLVDELAKIELEQKELQTAIQVVDSQEKIVSQRRSKSSLIGGSLPLFEGGESFKRQESLGLIDLSLEDSMQRVSIAIDALSPSATQRANSTSEPSSAVFISPNSSTEATLPSPSPASRRTESANAKEWATVLGMMEQATSEIKAFVPDTARNQSVMEEEEEEEEEDEEDAELKDEAEASMLDEDEGEQTQFKETKEELTEVAAKDTGAKKNSPMPPLRARSPALRMSPIVTDRGILAASDASIFSLLSPSSSAAPASPLGHADDWITQSASLSPVPAVASPLSRRPRSPTVLPPLTATAASRSNSRQNTSIASAPFASKQQLSPRLSSGNLTLEAIAVSPDSLRPSSVGGPTTVEPPACSSLAASSSSSNVEIDANAQSNINILSKATSGVLDIDLLLSTLPAEQKTNNTEGTARTALERAQAATVHDFEDFRFGSDVAASASSASSASSSSSSSATASPSMSVASLDPPAPSNLMQEPLSDIALNEIEANVFAAHPIFDLTSSSLDDSRPANSKSSFSILASSQEDSTQPPLSSTFDATASPANGEDSEQISSVATPVQELDMDFSTSASFGIQASAPIVKTKIIQKKASKSAQVATKKKSTVPCAAVASAASLVPSKPKIQLRGKNLTQIESSAKSFKTGSPSEPQPTKQKAKPVIAQEPHVDEVPAFQEATLVPSPLSSALVEDAQLTSRDRFVQPDLVEQDASSLSTAVAPLLLRPATSEIIRTTSSISAVTTLDIGSLIAPSTENDVEEQKTRVDEAHSQFAAVQSSSSSSSHKTAVASCTPRRSDLTFAPRRPSLTSTTSSPRVSAVSPRPAPVSSRPTSSFRRSSSSRPTSAATFAQHANASSRPSSSVAASSSRPTSSATGRRSSTSSSPATAISALATASVAECALPLAEEFTLIGGPLTVRKPKSATQARADRLRASKAASSEPKPQKPVLMLRPATSERRARGELPKVDAEPEQQQKDGEHIEKVYAALTSTVSELPQSLSIGKSSSLPLNASPLFVTPTLSEPVETSLLHDSAATTIVETGMMQHPFVEISLTTESKLSLMRPSSAEKRAKQEQKAEEVSLAEFEASTSSMEEIVSVACEGVAAPEAPVSSLNADILSSRDPQQPQSFTLIGGPLTVRKPAAAQQIRAAILQAAAQRKIDAAESVNQPMLLLRPGTSERQARGEVLAGESLSQQPHAEHIEQIYAALTSTRLELPKPTQAPVFSALPLSAHEVFASPPVIGRFIVEGPLTTQSQLALLRPSTAEKRARHQPLEHDAQISMQHQVESSSPVAPGIVEISVLPATTQLIAPEPLFMPSFALPSSDIASVVEEAPLTGRELPQIQPSLHHSSVECSTQHQLLLRPSTSETTERLREDLMSKQERQDVSFDHALGHSALCFPIESKEQAVENEVLQDFTLIGGPVTVIGGPLKTVRKAADICALRAQSATEIATAQPILMLRPGTSELRARGAVFPATIDSDSAHDQIEQVFAALTSSRSDLLKITTSISDLSKLQLPAATLYQQQTKSFVEGPLTTESKLTLLRSSAVENRLRASKRFVVAAAQLPSHYPLKSFSIQESEALNLEITAEEVNSTSDAFASSSTLEHLLEKQSASSEEVVGESLLPDATATIVNEAETSSDFSLVGGPLTMRKPESATQIRAARAQASKVATASASQPVLLLRPATSERRAREELQELETDASTHTDNHQQLEQVYNALTGESGLMIFGPALPTATIPIAAYSLFQTAAVATMGPLFTSSNLVLLRPAAEKQAKQPKHAVKHVLGVAKQDQEVKHVLPADANLSDFSVDDDLPSTRDFIDLGGFLQPSHQPSVDDGPFLLRPATSELVARQQAASSLKERADRQEDENVIQQYENPPIKMPTLFKISSLYGGEDDDDPATVQDGAQASVVDPFPGISQITDSQSPRDQISSRKESLSPQESHRVSFGDKVIADCPQSSSSDGNITAAAIDIPSCNSKFAHEEEKEADACVDQSFIRSI